MGNYWNKRKEEILKRDFLKKDPIPKDKTQKPITELNSDGTIKRIINPPTPTASNEKT